MLKSREEKQLEKTGAKLLGNISSHEDLQKALTSIRNGDSEEEQSLLLVNYLCLIEEFEQAVVSSNIHLKVLENIKSGNDNIVSQCAVILSRLVNDQNQSLISSLIAEDGIAVCTQALKGCQSNIVQLGLFQFFKQMVKYESGKVVASGAVECMLGVVRQQPNNVPLVKLLN